MTTALYRRYRPDTFQDVIGQEHVTAPLMAALRADRVTHAYLFSGPRGCGKTTSARILARCLNCEQYPTDTPCGQCPSCRDLATGGPGSLDVVEIDAASHNGVDDARDLRERASFAPARDRFKIFILDEAHMVTPQGFNALLKLVEEPPAHVKFIFATTEPEKVIGTIRSRTHHYPFRLVPPDILENYLAQLCAAEGVEVGPGVFPLVTRAGGGSVRDTLSVMDQLMGGAVDSVIDYQRAVALLGYTDSTLLDHCVDAIAAADGAGVFRVIDRVITSGHDPRRFVEDLLQRLRDLLVIALAGAEAGPALGSLPDDEFARMEVQARTLGSGALSRYADMTAQALTQMVGATSPRLQLELLMARLLVPLPISDGGQASASGSSRSDAAAHVSSSSTPSPGNGRALAAQIARQAAASHADAKDHTPHGPSAPQSPTAEAPSPVPASASVDTSRQSVSAPTQAQPSPQVRHGVDSSPQAQPPAAPPVQDSSAAVPVPAQMSERGATAASEHSSVHESGSSSTSAADAEMIRSRWPEVLDAAKRSRRATWALVEQHAQPGAFNDGIFRVIFTAPGLVSTFENGGHAQVLGQSIHQALGLDVTVHAVLSSGGDSGHSAPFVPAGPATEARSAAGSAHRATAPSTQPTPADTADAAGYARSVHSDELAGHGAGQYPPADGATPQHEAHSHTTPQPTPTNNGTHLYPPTDHAATHHQPTDHEMGHQQPTSNEPSQRQPAGQAGQYDSTDRPHPVTQPPQTPQHEAPSHATPQPTPTNNGTHPYPPTDREMGHHQRPSNRPNQHQPASQAGQYDSTDRPHPVTQPPQTPQDEPAEPIGWGEVAQIGRSLIAEAQGTHAPSDESHTSQTSPRDSAPGGFSAASPSAPSTSAPGAPWAADSSPLDAVALGTSTPSATASTPQQPTTALRPSSTDSHAGDSPQYTATSVPQEGGSAEAAPAGTHEEYGSSAPNQAGQAPDAQAAPAHASASTARPEAGEDVPPLATVHRLHPLPSLPEATRSASTPPEQAYGAGDSAASSPTQAGEATPANRIAVSAPSADRSGDHEDSSSLHARTPAQRTGAGETFSDGIPLPEEPASFEAPPESSWQPSAGAHSISAAMAAARAAANGQTPPPEVMHSAGIRLEDDTPSEDDEDAEEAGVVGLEVVKRILGATVLEDITLTPEDR